MAPLRAGLIGLGMMGRNHARVLRTLEGVDFVGACDVSGDPHDAAPGIPIVSSATQLIDLGLDLCVVAVPTRFHHSLGLQLAEAGVHTMIEKPLASTGAQSRDLALAFERAKVIGCVGHIERYNPALRALRIRLAEGELGDVYQVATRRQGPFPQRVADVGVVMDLATHDIDLTAWVTGQRYASVTAHIANRQGRAHEDLVAVVGQLSNGTITNHLVNWLSPMKERLTIATGARGCFVADTLSADLTFYENGQIPAEWSEFARLRGESEGTITRLAISKPEPLRVELETFRDAVLGRSADIVSLAEGCEVVEVAEAIISSAQFGQTISIPHRWPPVWSGSSQ